MCEIAALRAERAGLLGFGSHAEYALAEQTAGSVAAVMDHVAEVGAAASAAARVEAERHTAALHGETRTSGSAGTCTSTRSRATARAAARGWSPTRTPRR